MRKFLPLAAVLVVFAGLRADEKIAAPVPKAPPPASIDGKYTLLATSGTPLPGGKAKIDPTDPLGPKFRFKLYTVKMRAGKTYTIDMASGDFDTFLRLIDGQFRKLAEDDDTGGGANGTDSRIVFTPKADGEYHIVATSFDGGTGDYALTVRETD